MTIVKFVEIVMRYIWCLCVSPDIELLQELAQINEDDSHFQTVLPINNEIIEHYDNLMSGQVKVQELPYQEERKQIAGNNW